MDRIFHNILFIRFVLAEGYDDEGTWNFICDQACENRAYLHTKFSLIFEV